MSEPRTAAGREALTAWGERRRILAIEQEAAALDVGRVIAALTDEDEIAHGEAVTEA